MSGKYFTPNEILLHNKPTDLWVSSLGKVYNLTRLCKENKGSDLLKPILAFAGKDVSHWFNPRTGNPKMHVDKETGLMQPYIPHGRFLHIRPSFPSSDWATNFGYPWWKNKNYIIGNLSSNVRKIRIINTITSLEEMIEVCGEESLFDIRNRYSSIFNAHAGSYTWTREGRCLDMRKTLAENGIADDQPSFYRTNLLSDTYYPSILVYYDDDLTED